MKGKKTGGRVKGTPNKVSKTAREAALLAMIESGSNGRGEGGLDGFYRRWAKDDLVNFREKVAAPMATRIGIEIGAGDDDGPQQIRLVFG